uniref:Ion_trans domain-containing protein n=1 Tax=Macrostomum lignano TaxID=282301 RepID=A0A1I8IJ39_9PLAT
MDSAAALQAVNLAVILLCIVQRIPQVSKVIANGSTLGLDVLGLSLELWWFLSVQLGILFRYWPSNVITMLINSLAIVSAVGKSRQIYTLWRQKLVHNMSGATWLLAFTCSSARIASTLLSTGDFNLLMLYIINGSLNLGGVSISDSVRLTAVNGQSGAELVIFVGVVFNQVLLLLNISRVVPVGGIVASFTANSRSANHRGCRLQFLTLGQVDVQSDRVVVALHQALQYGIVLNIVDILDLRSESIVGEKVAQIVAILEHGDLDALSNVAENLRPEAQLLGVVDAHKVVPELVVANPAEIIQPAAVRQGFRCQLQRRVEGSLFVQPVALGQQAAQQGDAAVAVEFVQSAGPLGVRLAIPWLERRQGFKTFSTALLGIEGQHWFAAQLEDAFVDKGLGSFDQVDGGFQLLVGVMASPSGVRYMTVCRPNREPAELEVSYISGRSSIWKYFDLVTTNCLLPFIMGVLLAFSNFCNFRAVCFRYLCTCGSGRRTMVRVMPTSARLTSEATILVKNQTPRKNSSSIRSTSSLVNLMYLSFLDVNGTLAYLSRNMAYRSNRKALFSRMRSCRSSGSGT